MLIVGQRTLEIKNIILILVIGFIAFEVIEHLVMPIVFYCIRRKKKPFTGVESLLGEVVDVRQWEGKEGQVIIKGELWKAVRVEFPWFNGHTEELG